ncbi:TPA: hypothetical protein ACXDUQ_003296 [Clostridioides difficile]|uniref:hypothetical protein n=1 Tax=Clostridioides difficile TaxID=1496 RepID=UPI00093F042C|nr:hypothetical protein [Clostridioides difficile]EGT4846767.1 hypothetical protein [Clostridioides difficile]MCG3603571.1 hypothetical protein [Clostridioides difficile]MCI9896961.1 hypothetical protein [Clostridioides difficile]MCI9969996.1 hypothetical protein [Clostridioides difficile]MCJ0168761.1 hypothetical protein [Clostridioides difficile]
MSDYICRDEKGNNYIHIFNDGSNKGEICMYTNGFHYSYDVLTNRYYRLELSSSLRANYQSELIKKRISKNLFYEIMENIKNICKKEEEKNNKTYKNGMIIKCKNIAGKKLIKCKIINANYDYGYVEVKMLEHFTGNVVVKKQDIMFITQFMGYEGVLTNREKERIVMTSIVNRIVRNYINADSNDDFETMYKCSIKLRNICEKYTDESLYKYVKASIDFLIQIKTLCIPTTIFEEYLKEEYE